jgi:tight adherence protein C
MTDHGLTLSNISLFFSALLLFIGLVIILNARSEWHDRYRKRVAALHLTHEATDEPDVVPEENRVSPINIVRLLGDAISTSGLLSKRTLDELRQTLRIAGFRSRNAVGILVGAKMLLFVLLPMLGWLFVGLVSSSAALRLYVAVAGAVAGLLGPDLVIRHLRKRHLEELDAGLADALDMLVICSQAGLGLEPALERVGTEIRLAHPAVADELIQTSQEMKVNADRRLALINLGKRTGLESLKRLGSTLVQSMQYGTPVSDALRTLSAEQRQEMLNRFETKAGRLSVLLTIPMIVFILPCLFMVVGGPAIVNAIHVFRHH